MVTVTPKPFLWAVFMAVKGSPIAGVGINDAEFPISRQIVDGAGRKKQWLHPLYRAWVNMIHRCFSDNTKKAHPTYMECTMHEPWLRFSAFYSWAINQEWEGMELDKDVLRPGNKHYAPDTCVFITGELNGFLTARQAGRGAYPIGVSKNPGARSLLAHCNNPEAGKCEYLGSFSTAGAAHEAWRSKKHSHALRYADKQKDPRVAAALRVRYLEYKD